MVVLEVFLINCSRSFLSFDTLAPVVKRKFDWILNIGLNHDNGLLKKKKKNWNQIRSHCLGFDLNQTFRMLFKTF